MYFCASHALALYVILIEINRCHCSFICGQPQTDARVAGRSVYLVICLRALNVPLFISRNARSKAKYSYVPL